MLQTLRQVIRPSPFRDDVERIVRETMAPYILTIGLLLENGASDGKTMTILTRKRDFALMPICGDDSIFDMIAADLRFHDPSTPWTREEVIRVLGALIQEGRRRVQAPGAGAVHALIGNGSPVWN